MGASNAKSNASRGNSERLPKYRAAHLRPAPGVDFRWTIGAIAVDQRAGHAHQSRTPCINAAVTSSGAREESTTM